MKFIDFFAGIGGFHSGLEKAGMKCIGWCEFDKFAQKSYRAMYDTEGLWFGDDVTKVKGSELPSADLWTFGFPCQDVSIAGKQKGLKKGTRSGLFYEIMRLLDECKKINPNGLCAKTLRTCCQLTRDEDSLKLSVKWPKEGTLLNGRFATRKITECRKTAKGCSLLDVLETAVPKTFYISPTKANNLSFKSGT